jgi:hypothetical protein
VSTETALQQQRAKIAGKHIDSLEFLDRPTGTHLGDARDRRQAPEPRHALGSINDDTTMADVVGLVLVSAGALATVGGCLWAIVHLARAVS